MARALRAVLARQAHQPARHVGQRERQRDPRREPQPERHRGPMTSTDSPERITVDQYLAHPPARVWHALTDPDQLARWLMPNDFRPVVGHRFTFRAQPRPGQEFDGTVHCEVLDLEPERLLRIAWRGGRLDTTV